MLECNRFVKKKMTMLTRVVSVLIVVSCLVLLLSQTAFAKNTYVINDGDRVLIPTTYATAPAEVLDEAGLDEMSMAATMGSSNKDMIPARDGPPGIGW